MFNNRIFLAAIVTSICTMSVQARETITVINPSNKASPATVFAKSYEDALKKDSRFNVEFYQASSCADGDEKYRKTKNAVMVFNADVAIAARDKGVPCDFYSTAANTSLITKSYLKFCRKSGSNKEFGRDRTTLGIASVILSDGLMRDLNGGVQRKLVGVPYSGSKTILSALLAGDIDYGILGAGVVNSPEAAGVIECVYDYNPAAKNFIAKTFPSLKVPTLPIIQMIHTNATTAEVNGAIAKSVQDTEFLNSIKKNGFEDTKNAGITASDVNSVKSHIENVYGHYWKKP